MGEGSEGRRAEPKRLGFSVTRGLNNEGQKRAGSKVQWAWPPGKPSPKGAGPQLLIRGSLLGVLILVDKLKALGSPSGPKVRRKLLTGREML